MARIRKRASDGPWAAAIAHLRGADPEHIAPLIEQVGPCKLVPRADRFGTLVRAIVGQQISSKAAASIEARLRSLGGETYEARALLDLGEAAIRGAGLSGVKARYVLNLAAAVAESRVPLAEFDGWEDDAIIANLTAIKGIGVWTAEMFLIFALNRPDVFPAGDLGVRVALRDRRGLVELPTPAECRAVAERWRPFRTVASWYLWRHFDLPRTPTA